MEEKAKATKRKTTITFSLDADQLKQIEAQAKFKGISINSHVNNIITKYNNFYKPGEELTIHCIPRKSFLFLIDRVDEKEHAKHIEDHLFELIQVYFHQRKIPMTLENLINVFFNDIAINSGAVDTINYYVDTNGYTIIIVKHSYNIKWSNTCCYAFEALFRRLLNYHVEYESLQNSIILKILEKNILTSF